MLIVYEGDESENIPNVPLVDDSCCGPSCYDADVSNNSADYNLSHDDEHDDCNTSGATSVSSHQRGFAEAAARGAKTPFIPISEDTVFLEPEPLVTTSMSTLHPANSSPHSMDSWLNYSSTSSEEYSYAGGGQNVDETSIEFENSPKSAKINKRNHEHLDIRACSDPTDGTEEDEHNVDEELEPVTSISTTNSSKRVKGKEQKMSSKTPPHNVSRRSSYNRRTTNNLVDIRMIDFAHTTFVVQNGGVSFGTTNKKVSTNLGFERLIKRLFFDHNS